jgi:hypothetical protein
MQKLQLLLIEKLVAYANKYVFVGYYLTMENPQRRLPLNIVVAAVYVDSWAGS